MDILKKIEETPRNKMPDDEIPNLPGREELTGDEFDQALKEIKEKYGVKDKKKAA